MRGIRLSHGVSFIEHQDMTYRVLPSGVCEASPILLSVLEWDLRTEPPHTWDYLTDGDIRAMEGGIYEKILEKAERFA